MAPLPLDIAPVFQPWRQAGITHLLFDKAGLEALRQLTAPSTAAGTTGSTDAGTSTGSGKAAASAGGRPQPANREKNRAGAAVTTPAGSRAGSGQQRRPASAGGDTSGRPEAPVVRERPDTGHRPAVPERLPLSRWPEYWRSLLARTPQHPVVVWTYPALSRDLGGQADARHGAFLRRLLRDMNLKRGTSAFWPLNAFPYRPGCDENSVDASMFMSGIDALDPDMVVLLCGSAPPELGLGDLPPLMNMTIRGRYFVVTPHVDSLLEPSVGYSTLVTFLKGLLSRR